MSAADQPALLAVDDVEPAVHHEEVLGVGRDEDRDRRQDGTDRDHDEQREDVLRAPQRLVAVVERPADAELDVALLGVGDLLALAAVPLEATAATPSTTRIRPPRRPRH